MGYLFVPSLVPPGLRLLLGGEEWPGTTYHVSKTTKLTLSGCCFLATTVGAEGLVQLTYHTTN